EEIAAIAAAAASLRGDPKPEAFGTVAETKPVEEVKAVEESKLVEAVAEQDQVPEPAALVAMALPEVLSDEKKEEPAASVTEVKAEEPVAAEFENVHPQDGEVLAALASLTPANGDYSSEKHDEEPVTVAVGVPEAELA